MARLQPSAHRWAAGIGANTTRCRQSGCGGLQVVRAVADQPMVHQWEELAPPALQQGGQFYLEDVRIRSHEVGNNQQSSMITISNILQECASNHIVSLRGRSEQYFAADPELAKLDLIFVLTRMQIRMQTYPRWGDVVKAKTYFQAEGRVGARRDWILTNPQTAEQYGCATSSWVMVNYKTRRLSQIPKELKEDYETLMPDPPLHCIEKEETRQKLPALPNGEECASQVHNVSPVHVDMNNHVNNTAYLTWLLECMPSDVQASGRMLQYEVDYKAEAVSGDQMHVRTCLVHDPVLWAGVDSASIRQYITTIYKKGEDKDVEVMRARSTWTIDGSQN